MENKLYLIKSLLNQPNMEDKAIVLALHVFDIEISDIANYIDPQYQNIINKLRGINYNNDPHEYKKIDTLHQLGIQLTDLNRFLIQSNHLC